MRISLLTVAVAVTALCTAVPAAAQAPDAVYDSLLARFRGGDTTVATPLRMAFARTRRYDPYTTDGNDERQAMFAAYERHDMAQVLANANKMLAFTWLDAEAHFGASLAYQEMGDTARAGLHVRASRALVRSIGEGGGTSPQSPMKVISVAEEYVFMRAGGLRRGSQGLGECAGGIPCDVIEVTENETGNTSTLYFDVSLPTGHLSRMMDGGAKKGTGGRP